MVEIQNLNPNFKKIDKKLLKAVAEFVLRKERVKAGVEISVVIVEPIEIQRINKKYRKKNKPTDVLSFGSIKDFYDEDNFILPEIIICPEEVEKNRAESKLSFKKELAKVLIHGILHLLDFNHENGEQEEKAMLARQNKYLSIFFK